MAGLAAITLKGLAAYDVLYGEGGNDLLINGQRHLMGAVEHTLNGTGRDVNHAAPKRRSMVVSEDDLSQPGDTSTAWQTAVRRPEGRNSWRAQRVTTDNGECGIRIVRVMAITR